MVGGSPACRAKTAMRATVLACAVVGALIVSSGHVGAQSQATQSEPSEALDQLTDSLLELMRGKDASRPPAAAEWRQPIRYWIELHSEDGVLEMDSPPVPDEHLPGEAMQRRKNIETLGSRIEQFARSEGNVASRARSVEDAQVIVILDRNNGLARYVQPKGAADGWKLELRRSAPSHLSADAAPIPVSFRRFVTLVNAAQGEARDVKYEIVPWGVLVRLRDVHESPGKSFIWLHISPYSLVQALPGLLVSAPALVAKRFMPPRSWQIVATRSYLINSPLKERYRLLYRGEHSAMDFAVTYAWVVATEGSYFGAPECSKIIDILLAISAYNAISHNVFARNERHYIVVRDEGEIVYINNGKSVVGLHDSLEAILLIAQIDMFHHEIVEKGSSLSLSCR
jgi:hypothetical protein